MSDFALPDLVSRIRVDTSALKQAEGDTNSFGDRLKGAFGVAAAGVAVAGAAVIGFAATSVKKYEEVGSQVKEMSRVTGSSVESVSRLRFAAEESGLSTDKLSGAMVKLSKGLGETGHGLDATGIAFTDAHGKLLPLDASMLNIAEKFKSMPDGVEKNRLAMQLFGKSGTDLIPFLDKGKDGLGALEAQADKLGITMGTKDLDALKANAIAHKEFGAAVEALEIKVGGALLPTLTKLAEIFNSAVIPAITAVTGWVAKNLAPAFDKGFGEAERIVRSFTEYIRDVVSPVVLEKIQGIRDKVEPVFDAVKEAYLVVYHAIKDDVLPAMKDQLEPFIKNTLVPTLSALSGVLTNNVGPAFLNFRVAAITGVIISLAEFSGALRELGILQFVTSPFGLALVAVGLFIGVIEALSGHTKSIQEFGNTIKSSLTGIDFAGARKHLENFLQDATPNVVGFLTKLSKGIETGSTNIVDGVKAGIEKGDWSKLGSALSDAISAAVKGIGSAGAGLGKAIGDLIQAIPWASMGKSASAGFKSFVSGINWIEVATSVGTALGDAISGAASVIVKITAAIGKLLKSIDWVGIGLEMGKQAPALLLGLALGILNFDLGRLLSGLADHWTDVLFGLLAIAFTPAKWIGKIGELLTRVPLIGPLLKWALDGLKGVADGFLSGAVKAIESLGKGFLDGIGVLSKTSPAALREMLATFLTTLGVKALDLFAAAQKFIGKIPEAILSGLEGIGKSAGQIGLKLIESVGSAGKWLLGTGALIVGGLITGLIDTLPSVIGFFITLPLKIAALLVGAGVWLVVHGAKLIGGLVSGLVSALPAIIKFFLEIPLNIIKLLVAAGTWLVPHGLALLRGLGSGIIAGAKAVWEFFTDLPATLGAFFKAAPGWLLSHGSALLKGLGDGIIAGAEAVWAWFLALPGTVWGLIKDIGTWLLDQGKGLIKGLLQGAEEAGADYWQYFKDMPGKVWEILKDIGTWLLEHGKKLIIGILNGVHEQEVSLWNWFLALPGNIWNMLKDIGGWLLDHGKGLIRGLWNGIVTVAEDVWGFFRDLPGRVWGFLGGIGGWLLEHGKGLLRGMIDGINAGANWVWDWLRAFPGNFLRGLSNIGNLLLGVGHDIIDGLKRGVEGAWHFVTEAIGRLVGGIAAPIKKLLGISSPSKVMADLGKEIPAGFVEGIMSGADGVSNAMGHLGNKVGNARFSTGDFSTGDGVGSLNASRGGNTYNVVLPLVPYTPEQVADESVMAMVRLEQMHGLR